MQSSPAGYLKKKNYVRAKLLGSVVTGLVAADDSDISIVEMDWATFSNPVLTNPADYAGIYVVIIDRFVDSRGINRARFVGGAEWSLDSPHIYYATFDLPPNPAQWPGLRVLIGAWKAVMVSDGTYYRFQSRSPVLVARFSNVSKSSAVTVEEILAQFAIPRNNGKSLLQNGDRIILDHNMYATSLSTNHMFRDMQIGTTGTVAGIGTTDASLETRAVFGSTSAGNDEIAVWERISATSVLKESAQGTQAYIGANTVSRPSAVTVPNMDSNDSFFSASYKCDASGPTLLLRKALIFIHHAGF